jgi:hypothetical protein
MFEAFRDPQYGRPNLIVALVLGTALLLAMGWIWLAGINLVEVGLATIAVFGLVLVARWITGGILFSAWYGGRGIRQQADDPPDDMRDRRSRER